MQTAFFWTLTATGAAVLGYLSWYNGLTFEGLTERIRYEQRDPRTLVFIASAGLAYVAFLFNNWFASRTAKVSASLDVIQRFRTDSDYLERATLVADWIKGFGVAVTGRPLEVLLAKNSDLDEKAVALTTLNDRRVSERDMARNVDFLLNQYEFVAAGVRLGAVDKRLIEETMRATTLGFAIAFEEYIRKERAQSPATWANLVWLCHQFDPDLKIGAKLGPRPMPLSKPIRRWFFHTSR